MKKPALPPLPLPDDPDYKGAKKGKKKRKPMTSKERKAMMQEFFNKKK